MFSHVHYFILISFRYRYSRNYIRTTTLCGNLYALRNNAMFFFGTEVKDLDICIVLSPYARSKIKSGTLTSFVNQKRLPGGPNALCRRENPASVPIPQVI